ncbi:AEC family transporter, partial [Xanthomonas sp. Kuri4-2]
MFTTMTTALLPVVILMFLGWFGGRRGHFQRADVSVMATLVTRYALPVSLFLGALNTPPEKLGNLPFVACMTFGFVGTYLIALLVARFGFGHDLRTSALQALVCTFPDMAYFGAPILAQVCGPEGFIAVLVGNLITSLVILPLTIVLTSWGDGAAGGIGATLRASIGRTLGNPLVWLPLAGAVMSWSGYA